MNADTLTTLCKKGDVEAKDSFRRQFSVVWKFDDTVGSFVRKISIFGLLFSHVRWLVGIVFGPVLLS